MSISVGEDLSVIVPVNALVAIGNFEKDTPNLQKYFNKIFSRYAGSLTEKQKNEVENYKPYWCNLLLAPIPISTMIEENVTFETAIQSSYQKMKDFCCQLDMQFEMIELMHLSNMMFETTVDELVSSALSIFSDIAKTIPEENTQNRYEVPLSNVSPKLSDTLEHLGILTLAEKLSTVESLTDILQASVIDPITAAILKCCKEKFEDFETDLSGREELNKIINDMSEDLKNQFFIKSVLSIILTKAISDNITLAEAKLAFDEETLLNLATKEFMKIEALKNCATKLEKMVYSICDLSY